jgi:hypothetical protein
MEVIIRIVEVAARIVGQIGVAVPVPTLFYIFVDLY